MPEPDDLTRLRMEYAERGQRNLGRDQYSLFNLPHLFTIQQRQRKVLQVLRRSGFFPWADHSILELGCGNGNVLLEYLSYGAARQKIFGIDLLEDRVRAAKSQHPGFSVACGDGRQLPYAKNQFDLVLQYTVFSSILDPQVKLQIAREMLRILKRPHGMILWYDFWLNPTNAQTRGIRPTEIKNLFPECSFRFHRVTLAPPLGRRLVPISWVVALLLEKLKIMNSHYLVAIQPKRK